MRILLIGFLVLLGFSKSVFAEYNGYHLKVEFEMMWGEKRTGYTYLTAWNFDKDSTDNQAHLKRAFQYQANEQGKIAYGKNEIVYHYSPIWALSERSQHYCIVDLDSINVFVVSHFKIIEVHEQSYAQGMRNELSLPDTAWINTPPNRSMEAGGFFCSHQIMVHIENEENSRVLKEIDALNAKLEAMPDEEIDEKFEDIDQLYEELLAKLNLDYLVVLSVCTC
jgi:hypothetical protein